MNRLNIRFISTVILVAAADILTKLWAVKNLDNYKQIILIEEYLTFKLVYNTGGVFGIFQGNPMFFQVLTGLAIIFLVIYYLKTPEYSTGFSVAISFILGGAVGNFTDRFFRPGVVDFIDMGIGTSRWPTYNIADAFISTGAVLLAIAFFVLERRAKNAAGSNE